MAVKTKSNRKKSKGRTRRAKPLLGRSDDVRRSSNGSAKVARPSNIALTRTLWRAMRRCQCASCRSSPSRSGAHRCCWLTRGS